MCAAARNGAACTNRKSVRRSPIEEAVLEGLKSHLMAPDLVEEFIRAFHEELNRKHAADDLEREGRAQELARLSRKLRGLYDAIADGLGSAPSGGVGAIMVRALWLGCQAAGMALLLTCGSSQRPARVSRLM